MSSPGWVDRAPTPEHPARPAAPAPELAAVCPMCRGAGTVTAAAAPHLRPVHFLLSNLKTACENERDGDRFSAIPADVSCASCVYAMVNDE